MSLKATIDNKTFCLCTLVAGTVDQAALDLNFSASQEVFLFGKNFSQWLLLKVTFITEGDDIPVHLTGYYEVSDDVPPEDEGEEEEEDEDEEMVWLLEGKRSAGTLGPEPCKFGVGTPPLGMAN